MDHSSALHYADLLIPDSFGASFLLWRLTLSFISFCFIACQFKVFPPPPPPQHSYVFEAGKGIPCLLSLPR